MINLLPPDVKQNITYARRNTKLRKWSISIFATMIGIMLILAVGYIYLRQSIQSFTTQVELANQNLKAQKLEETQAEVQDLTDSLKLVVQVLQRQILFSKLIQQTGAALPGGSVLTNLSINKIQGGLDLQAGATDYQTATQVQLNLQDTKNKIFEKADLINIQCLDPKSAGTQSFSSQYPCTVQVRALFAKNSSFSLINTTPGAGAKP